MFFNGSYKREKALLETQREEIEESIRSQKRFLANMSHEIRTPINTIIGLNEINLRGDLNDDARENCQSINEASKMLLAMINDILDFSKIESGKMDIIPEEYEVVSLLREVINMNLSKIKEKGLDFELNVSKDIPSKLYGDTVRIRQVLINIFTNAVKYTPKGRIFLSLGFETIDDDNIKLIAAVKDTGKGMRPESIVHLFDAYKRVDEKENRYIEGTGLGLSITKQLVDLMNGTIAVDSVYGKGSVFTVMIPQKVIDKNPVGDAASAMQEKSLVKGNYHAKFKAPDARVLIVDDNRMNLTVAARLLEDTKVQTDMALSGHEALKMTEANHYNVILMDHQMPEMDGPATLDAIRSQPMGLCQKVPIIALTANAGSGLEEMYKDRGFQGYIVKPINSMHLESTVLKFLPEDLVQITERSEDRMDVEVGSIIKKRMMVTAESFCDLSKTACDESGIGLISGYVEVNGRRLKDRDEIFSENLIDSGITMNVMKAVPSVEDYEAFFAQKLHDSEYVIHVSAASTISKAYSNAKKAAESFDHVRVVDSGSVSVGIGLVATLLAKKAAEGMKIEELDQVAAGITDAVSTYIMIRDAEAIRGSHTKSISGVFAKSIWQFLDMHPVIEVKKGRMKTKGIIGGDSSFEIFISRIKKQKPAQAFYTHAGVSPTDAKAYMELLNQTFGEGFVKKQQTSFGLSDTFGKGTVAISLF